MKTFALLVLSAAALVFNVSCSGGGGGGGGGSSEPAVWSMAEPSPKCAKPFKLPDAFAQTCNLGTNMSLCASRTSQCDASLCLADNRAASVSYCTVSCDPKKKNVCPSGFSCLKEECDDRFVCVRSANVDPLAGFMVREEKLPARQGNFTIRASVVNAAGERMVLTSGSELFLRKTSGEWVAMHMESPLMAEMYPDGLSAVGNAFYVFSSTAYYQTITQDSRTVYRIENGQVSLVPVPSDRPGMICNGTPGSGCNGEVLNVWGEGTSLYALIQGPSNIRLFKRDGDTWTRQVADTQMFAHAAVKKRLADGSFLAFGNQGETVGLFVSADLKRWKEVEVPVAPKEVRRLEAFAINDIWIFDDAGKVHHWIGDKWVKERDMENVQAITKLGPGRYLGHTGGGKTLSLQGKCWRELPAVPAGAFPLGAQAGFVDDQRVVIFEPGFVPEY